MKRNALFALYLFLGFTLLYLAAAALTVPNLAGTEALARSNHLPPSLPQPAMSPTYLLRDIWLRFDTVWYLEIARDGYRDPRAIVFYPLYPLLIRGLSLLLEPMTAALLLSRLAAFFLLWGLLELLSLDLPEKTARFASFLLLLWPAGFMLFAAYPDALILALSVWALWFARKELWWPAALCAACACTAKAAGAAVVLALFVLAWKSRPRPVLPMLLAAAGAAIYPAALLASGLPLPNTIYRAHWLTTPAWPWETLWAATTNALGPGDFVARMDLLALLLIAAAALLWRPRFEYTVYSATLLLLFLTKKTDPLLQSTMRYLTAIFPAFASAALYLRQPFLVVLLAFLCMLFHALFLFAFWRWSLVV